MKKIVKHSIDENLKLIIALIESANETENRREYAKYRRQTKTS